MTRLNHPDLFESLMNLAQLFLDLQVRLDQSLDISLNLTNFETKLVR
jgi:hypothetical protein